MTALSHFSNFLFQHIICRIRFIYFKHCLFHRTHTCFITIYNILNQITVICLNLIFFKNIKCMRAYNIGINLFYSAFYHK